MVPTAPGALTNFPDNREAVEGKGGFVQWTMVTMLEGGGRRAGAEVIVAVDERCCVCLHAFNPPGSFNLGAVITPTLQVRKLRFREIK